MFPVLTMLLLSVMAVGAVLVAHRLSRAVAGLEAAVARTGALHDAGAALETTLEHAQDRRSRLRDSVSRTADR